MYKKDMMKQVKPEPIHTAKHISLWVVVIFHLNLSKKLLLDEESLSNNELSEYCELNIVLIIIMIG